MIKPRSGFMEMLSDPDEGRFLRAMLGGSLEEGLLVGYARQLEKRDRDRSEFLSLDRLLSGAAGPGEVTPTRQARYLELLRRLEPYDEWLKIVRRNDRVLNCGSGAAQHPAVRFRFRCPTSWEALAPTPEPGVRHCAGCRRDVYYCDNIGSAEQHARAGDCITIPTHLTNTLHDELTRDYTGMPEVIELWGNKLFGNDGRGRSDGTTDPDQTGSDIAADEQ